MDENGNRKLYYRYLHRLVYESFNGKIAEGMTVDHINNNKDINRVENLQELTRKENSVKRSTVHNISNMTLYKVTDFDTSEASIMTSTEICNKYNIPRKKVIHISNRLDRKSFGKLKENGLNIKIERVEDSERVDND